MTTPTPEKMQDDSKDLLLEAHERLKELSGTMKYIGDSVKGPSEELLFDAVIDIGSALNLILTVMIRNQRKTK